MIKYECTPTGSDPFGELATGWLTLRWCLVAGSLCRFRTYYGNDRMQEQHPEHHDSLLLGTGTYEERRANMLKNISLDVDSPEDYAALESTSLYDLKIFEGKRRDTETWKTKVMTPEGEDLPATSRREVRLERFLECSLILRASTRQEGHFERIGIHSEWADTRSSVYDEIAETTLTII